MPDKVLLLDLVYANGGDGAGRAGQSRPRRTNERRGGGDGLAWRWRKRTKGRRAGRRIEKGEIGKPAAALVERIWKLHRASTIGMARSAKELVALRSPTVH